MFVVNASPSSVDYLYYVNNSQNVKGWQLDNDGDLTDTEQEYTGFPVTYNTIQNNTTGEISGVEVTIPNVNRSIESVIQDYNYLRGCEVYIIYGFADNLPSGSEDAHIGTNPDYRSFIKEKFYVDSCTSNQDNVTFSCKSKFNIQNIVIPGRKYARECQWSYLGSECNPLSTVAHTATVCDKTLKDCKYHENEARFGGFPSVGDRTLRVL
jgi:lambda family phage minor tail protein L